MTTRYCCTSSMYVVIIPHRPQTGDVCQVNERAGNKCWSGLLCCVLRLRWVLFAGGDSIELAMEGALAAMFNIITDIGIIEVDPSLTRQVEVTGEWFCFVRFRACCGIIGALETVMLCVGSDACMRPMQHAPYILCWLSAPADIPIFL